MISRAIAFSLMGVLAVIARLYPWREEVGGSGELAVSLGLVILAGYLVGEMGAMIKLPRITGYLLAGMLLGPYVTGFLSETMVTEFSLINQIALALIALSAGGEFKLTSLKARWRGMVWITGVQVVGIFLLGTMGFYLLAAWLPFLSQASVLTRLGCAMVFGVMAVAQSPATTIAVVTDTRASGSTTETVLGIVVIIDILVIILFSILLPIVKGTEAMGGGWEWQILLNLAGEIFLSIGAGVAAGWCISLYIQYVRKDPVLFVLALSYLVSEGSKTLHLDTLIICIAAGIWVTNASNQGEHFIKMIEESSLIVYVIFFTLTGAALNMDLLVSSFQIAMALVLMRVILTYGTTAWGMRLSGETFTSPHTLWLAFLSQAGVSLGLLSLLMREGISWSRPFQTILIGVIAINQLIGPILLKYALQCAGEIRSGKKRTAEEPAAVQAD